MKFLQKIPTNLTIIIKQYILSLTIYFIFRLILFGTEINRIDDSVNFIDILHSFLLGFRFDLVVSSYILILPFVLLSINTIAEKDFKLIRKIVFAWCCIFSIGTFLFSIIDIPFFNHFFTRLTYSSFDALKDGNAGWILSMISEEFKYWIFFVVFVFLSILYVVFSKKTIITSVNTSIQYKKKNVRVILNSFFFIIGFALIFFGIRGRFAEKSPIRIGTAYFCNNNFLNQLGLNPNFTLLASFVEYNKNKNKQIHLISDTTAIKYMQLSLGINKHINSLAQTDTNHPLQQVSPPITDAFKGRNLILVIMESMSAAKMKRYGNNNDLTPFLDSIANLSIRNNNNTSNPLVYCFDNMYSTTVRTYGGVFSTLFSNPIVFGKNVMKIVPLLKFSGISDILKQNNYSTIYFTTHDGQFDGIQGFLYHNDFEKIIEQSHYPIADIKTTMGVPDDIMFKNSLKYLNNLAKNKKPFFATYLTGSDHLPYYIPDYFTPKHKDIKFQATNYADWSLRTFLKECEKQNWYNNSIFVFVADHGTAIDVTYKMSLSHYHIPFIILIPNSQNIEPHFINDTIFHNIASQIDVAPTLVSLLGINYLNLSLGIDLFSKLREISVLDGTTSYAAISKNHLLIVNSDLSKNLYHHTTKDRTDYHASECAVADSMDFYARCYLQTSDYILRSKSKLK